MHSESGVHTITKRSSLFASRVCVYETYKVIRTQYTLRREVLIHASHIARLSLSTETERDRDRERGGGGIENWAPLISHIIHSEWAANWSAGANGSAALCLLYICYIHTDHIYLYIAFLGAIEGCCRECCPVAWKAIMHILLRASIGEKPLADLWPARLRKPPLAVSTGILCGICNSILSAPARRKPGWREFA
jgi:hypothetical protein